jgi:hypothetical protein
MMISMRKLSSLGLSTISKYRPGLWIKFFTEGYGRLVLAQGGPDWAIQKSQILGLYVMRIWFKGPVRVWVQQ